MTEILTRAVPPAECTCPHAAALERLQLLFRTWRGRPHQLSFAVAAREAMDVINQTEETR